MSKKTEKQEALPPLETRIKQFEEELRQLLAKHRLGITAVAGLTQDGRITAQPRVFDDKPSEKKVGENLEKSE